MGKEEGKGEMGKGEREKGLPAKFATLLYTDIDILTILALFRASKLKNGLFW